MGDRVLDLVAVLLGDLGLVHGALGVEDELAEFFRVRREVGQELLRTFLRTFLGHKSPFGFGRRRPPSPLDGCSPCTAEIVLLLQPR